MDTSAPSKAVVAGQRLDGWKSIARYAGRSERAVQRWAIDRKFPVHRVGGGQTGSVYAWAHEIDTWFAQQAAGSTAEPSYPPEPPAPHGTQPGGEAPAPEGRGTGATNASPPRRHGWVAVLTAAVLGVLAGIAGTWAVVRPRASNALPPGTIEPCHAVEWPSHELPATGGRWRLPVRALTAPCDHWVAPTTESRWLLVTPPSTLTTPRRITMSPIHPLAMPAYEPDATSLSLDLAANHTAAPREAVLQFGGSRIRIRQAGMREACVAEPGPGYIDGRWRYRMTRRRYGQVPGLLSDVQREVGAHASGVSWQMLMDLLDGNPDRGVEFAAAVGIPRHSWEENVAASTCFNVWLTESAPPAFISYHMGRMPVSYTVYLNINENQFDLGRFHHIGQALYRERVP